MSAQCVEFAGGPYSIGTAGCNGDTILASFEAWKNEAYFADLVAGGNYTFALPGCNAIAWGGVVEITVIEGGTVNAANDMIIGGTATMTTGCAATFTATTTGIAYFVLTTIGGCGAPLLATNNGVPTVITNSGIFCGVCRENGCETGEDYCSCPADCDCTGINPIFLIYGGGGVFPSPGPVVYCGLDLGAADGNSSPATVYVPFAPIGNQDCVADWGITADFGSLYFPGFTPIVDTIGDSFIGWLGLTDADLVSSSGVVTLTFTDFTTPNGCTFDLTVDMAMAVESDSTAWAGTATSACPSCTPAGGSFVSYDCATPSVTVNITGLGVPSAGATGFVAEVRTADGSVVGGGIPLALGNMVIPLPDNSQIYNVILTDGVSTNCEVGFFNNELLYGDCREAAGPAPDCEFIMDDNTLDGSFESGSWVGSMTGVINNAFPLDDTLHVLLGGFGVAGTYAAMQTITIPVSTSATMHFWIWLPGCAGATDVFQVTIDGTVVNAFGGANPNCGGNWYEISVNISAYADGGTHTIAFTLSETGSGGGDGYTAAVIDNVVIEACGITCSPNLVLTTSETGNQTYQAGNSIISTDDVLAVETVVYDAGSLVCLENDFSAVAGTDFAAIIGGCTALLAQNNSSDNVYSNSKAAQTGKNKAIKKNFAKNIAPADRNILEQRKVEKTKTFN